MTKNTQAEKQKRLTQRRKSVLREIKDQVAIFSAAPEQIISRDQHAPFRQNSDFFYLTGIQEPHAVLVLLGKKNGPRSILYLRERETEKELWTGETLGLRRAKRRLSLDEVRELSSFRTDLPELLHGAEVLHYAPGSEPVVDTLIWEQLKNTMAPSSFQPAILKDSRLLTSSMRLKKDRIEIQAMRHVCSITARSFEALFAELAQQKSEKHAAATLESHFARFGADGPAFQTIVAAGKNATTLHHMPKFQPLWKRELVLIDAGASYRGYAGDITRTIPVQGRFTEQQASVYDVVHEALSDAISCCKPGATLDEVHSAACRAITKGLIRLGVLEGHLAQLLSQNAYKPFFMHQTSHWLGLDVHDISPTRFEEFAIPARLRPLEAGNVFTVEPGLYFRANDDHVPHELRGIGIRLEEDVLITRSGCEVLTEQLPVAREEIEKMLN